MRELAHFMERGGSADVAPLLESLSQTKDTLIVFNHPCWDESGIGSERHLKLAAEFRRKHSPFLHALELNGLRPWTENREVFGLAHALAKPGAAGGAGATVSFTGATTESCGRSRCSLQTAYRAPLNFL
jgi:hypothetical protein